MKLLLHATRRRLADLVTLKIKKLHTNGVIIDPFRKFQTIFYILHYDFNFFCKFVLIRCSFMQISCSAPESRVPLVILLQFSSKMDGGTQIFILVLVFSNLRRGSEKSSGTPFKSKIVVNVSSNVTHSRVSIQLEWDDATSALESSGQGYKCLSLNTWLLISTSNKVLDSTISKVRAQEHTGTMVMSFVSSIMQCAATTDWELEQTQPIENRRQTKKLMKWSLHCYIYCFT